jgi:site-specific DNA recombinase
VAEEIKAIGRDPALVAATVAESRRLVQAGVKRLKAERGALERQRRADEAELGRRAATAAQDGDSARLAEVQERIEKAERRQCQVKAELARLLAADISELEIETALKEFDSLWATLTPKEQARILALLIERIDHDGEAGSVEVTFHPVGLKALSAGVPSQEETAA